VAADARARAATGTRSGPERMTEEQISATVTAISDLMQALRYATTEDKAEVYAGLKAGTRHSISACAATGFSAPHRLRCADEVDLCGTSSYRTSRIRNRGQAQSDPDDRRTWEDPCMPVRRPVDVPIREESIRLGQFLKLAELVEAGSDAKELISAGDVLANGEPETRRGRQLRIGDVVELNGRPARVARRPGSAAVLADQHKRWRLPSAALERRAWRGMRLEVRSNPPQVDIVERVARPARLHAHSCRCKGQGSEMAGSHRAGLLPDITLSGAPGRSSTGMSR